MRVITGTARGRKIREPDGYNIRPTSDMVKESMFNIIQFDIEGRRVLDLFAGTGQLGIEALSRGARSCVFVDESSPSARLIKENLRSTGLEKDARVFQGEAISFLKKGERYDLIIVDPPYESGLLDKTLRIIVEFDILSEGGIIVCESHADKDMPELEAPYQKLKEYHYGKVKITLYART